MVEKEKAIICDLDGTLALFKEKGHRGPFEWKKCIDDEVNGIMEKLIDLFDWDRYWIIIVSGRDGCCRQETLEWLEKHSIRCHELFMRPEGNYEIDTVIKKRIYEEHIKDKYDVEVVFDDRDSVVKMWRDLGLTCFQVAEGNF